MKNLICFMSLFMITGCNYAAYHDPLAPNNEGGQSICLPEDGVGAPAVDFAEVKSKVFQGQCIGCHSSSSSAGGLNLESYTSAQSFAAQILFDVKNNIMPKAPRPSLSQTDKDLVAAWVNAGAPETISTNCNESNDGTITNPTDDIEGPITVLPDDSKINYTLVREKVFKVHCFSCHSQMGGNVGGLNLETHFNTLDEIDDIEEEVFKKTMPPRSRPALSDVERNVILRWIALGAPQ